MEVVGISKYRPRITAFTVRAVFSGIPQPFT
jgi:hypothetical protein